MWHVVKEGTGITGNRSRQRRQPQREARKGQAGRIGDPPGPGFDVARVGARLPTNHALHGHGVAGPGEARRSTFDLAGNRSLGAGIASRQGCIAVFKPASDRGRIPLGWLGTHGSSRSRVLRRDLWCFHASHFCRCHCDVGAGRTGLGGRDLSSKPIRSTSRRCMRSGFCGLASRTIQVPLPLCRAPWN